MNDHLVFTGGMVVGFVVTFLGAKLLRRLRAAMTYWRLYRLLAAKLKECEAARNLGALRHGKGILARRKQAKQKLPAHLFP